MSWSFDVTGATAYVSMTAGSAGAVSTGGYTLAVLCLPAAGNNNAGFMRALVSGAASREIFEDTNALYGDGDFSSGFGTLTQGNWYLIAQTKAAGSNTYRHHIWQYASDGSGTMTHGVASGSGTHGDGGSAATELRVGAGAVKGNGLIAVIGVWTRALSDAELDSMKSNLLTKWRDVSGGQPAELIHSKDWDGSTGSTITVGIGTSSFSSVTGTVAAGANPTSFDFTLGGGGSAVNAPDSGGLGMSIRSSGGTAVTGVLAVSDTGLGLKLRSASETVATGTLAANDTGLGLRLRSASETVVAGVAIPDSPGMLRFLSADGQGAGSGTSATDAPGMLRMLSADGAGVTTGVAVPDAPGLLRLRSSDGLGAGSGVSIADTPGMLRLGAFSVESVVFGVGIPDNGLGIRLGMPSAAVAIGVVVSDTPGLLRTGSGQSSVLIGSTSAVTVLDSPGWLRIGQPGALVAIQTPPTQPPLIAQVRRISVDAPVERHVVIAPVEVEI